MMRERGRQENANWVVKATICIVEKKKITSFVQNDLKTKLTKKIANYSKYLN